VLTKTWFTDMQLQDQFLQSWKRFGYMEQTLLGVSGGADSMVMAALFLRAGLKFGVGHCNFQLRGHEADLDEQLVRNWCTHHNIPFYNIRFDTKKWCEEWKKGTQETARILRYEWFQQICSNHHYSKLATAHHANDNVETLLMNLFKGTGMNGMHGIPEQNGNIIRPLLFATKESIVAYAAENEIPYREDASNATDAYLRNAVRLNILPVVQQSFPNAIQSVSDTIGRLAQAQELYNKAVARERKRLIEQRGNDFYIPILKLTKSSPLETLLYELITPFGFLPAQLPHVLQLLHAESGHYVSSQTHRVIRNRNFLIITQLAAGLADMILIKAAPCNINAGNHTFTFTIADKPATVPQQSNTACIDLHKVEFPLILRRWCTGDYFYPLGMGMKKKKLSKYFKDQKIALHEKDHVWVLETQKRIAWVAGMRLDERFKITDRTEKVLLVKMNT
jgi:tRNA(Ile)-lysidine synthase